MLPSLASSCWYFSHCQGRPNSSSWHLGPRPASTRSRGWKSLHPTFCFPQQHKLIGSSAQNNSSGVHWCRRRVRFNEVPEKVPKLPEKVWEALVQSQARFNRIPEKGPVKVWEALVPEKVWEALVQSQVKFNRVLEKVSEKVPGSCGAKPSQVQQVPYCRRFRRRLGRLWCRASSGSTGSRRRFRRRFREALEHAEVFPAFGFAAFVKIKRCSCWGYHRNLFHLFSQGFWHVKAGFSVGRFSTSMSRT